MEKKNSVITFYEKRTRPTFGALVTEAIYIMEHKVNYDVNKYKITCQIRGIEIGAVYMTAEDAVCINSNDEHGELITNQETLVREAVLDLFESEMEW